MLLALAYYFSLLMLRGSTSIFPYLTFHFRVAIILRQLHTKFMSLNKSVVLEPIANIKTLLLERNCSPINCCHRVIAKRSLCQQLKSSMGDIFTSLIH